MVTVPQSDTAPMEGRVNVITLEQSVPLTGTLIIGSAGSATAGATSSFTVTINEVEAVRPLLSVAT